MGYSYKFFGLAFYSNLPLPGMPSKEDSAESSDLVLHLGISPPAQAESRKATEELTYTSSDRNEKGEPILQIWTVNSGDYVRMGYDDGTQFWVDHGLKNIWATWPDYLPIENVTCYLLGPVVGLLLRLRGVICLHASAVAIENRGVAFVGSPGAGKSTTAAAFSKLGYAILSDDITALEERDGAFRVHAAHPQICLWPESVKMLYGTPEALPRLNPRWDKRRLMLGEQEAGFKQGLIRLGAIYVLGERRPDGAPYVEEIRAQTALLALVADTYANKILDRNLRAREFEVLGRLITTVPIRQVHASEAGNQLGELCKVVLEDLASRAKSPGTYT